VRHHDPNCRQIVEGAIIPPRIAPYATKAGCNLSGSLQLLVAQKPSQSFSQVAPDFQKGTIHDASATKNIEIVHAQLSKHYGSVANHPTASVSLVLLENGRSQTVATLWPRCVAGSPSQISIGFPFRRGQLAKIRQVGWTRALDFLHWIVFHHTNG
jgi:hypothetical protein